MGILALCQSFGLRVDEWVTFEKVSFPVEDGISSRRRHAFRVCMWVLDLA
jgi:hypothetical protein